MASNPTPEKQALLDAAKALGSKSELARGIGLSKQGIHPYFHTDRPFPADYCPTVERLTEAAGKRVMCEQLRPDVEWGVLRHPAPKRRAADKAPRTSKVES